MTRRSLHRQVDWMWNLLHGLDRSVQRTAADARHASTFRQAILGVDFGVMLVGHEIDSDAASAFFTGFGEEDHVAIQWNIQSFKHQQRHQARHHVRLVVERAARIDVAFVPRSAEWREGPLLWIDGDDVRVSHQKQRLLSAITFQACDKTGTIRLTSEYLDSDTFLFEDSRQII